ncbi:ATP-binding protein [Lyngbya aestuarii]|uniref:ATP-binding protein n=1 Tax=Lyngbya aestuarii TaxID=118322 RepID=UPI00403DBC24
MNKTPIHVLLVEDSPDDAALQCRRFLRLDQEQWQVTHVELFSEAINACGNNQIDVILLDLNLPDSKGLETVVKFVVAVPNVPIVVLTGCFDDQETALNALGLGAQDYLVKDQITMPLLVRTIRYAIERGQILKQLQDSERRFRGIFHNSFELRSLLTPEGNILEINQTALDLWGVKQEEVTTLRLWEMKCWSDSPEIQEQLQAAIAQAANGNTVRNEFPVRTTSEVVAWIDFSLKPLQDDRGKVILLIAEGRDITNVHHELRLRKQAEAELLTALTKEREFSQMKLNFVSLVSHEFRTPLTTIRSCKDLLVHYCRESMNQQKSKHFQRIEASINRMLHLLDNLLLVGQAEAGKLEFKPICLNLIEFCSDLVEELQINASSTHEIVFTHSGTCINAYMDETLLRLLLGNLLSNAIKYSPEGGNVTLALLCQDEVARFRIQDHGIGIPQEEASRLFESFQRASNVGKIEGTGLGLSLVKKSVDLHGGKIVVESEVGVGTTFTIILPLKSVVANQQQVNWLQRS